MSQYDIYNIFDMASSYMRPSEEQHVTEVVAVSYTHLTLPTNREV